MATAWATKRKFLYTTTFLIIISIIIGVPTYLHFKKPPTCFDTIKNQDEEGVDCGGVCQKLCAEKQLNPVVLWSRTFKVSEGVYNAVAYIENPNQNAEAFSVPYIFRIYDSKNILINEKQGVTFIPVQKAFPIFEGPISTGERIPSHVTLEFLATPDWQRAEQTTFPLVIKNQKLTGEEFEPRLDAQIENTGVRTIDKVEIVATLFDSRDNAIAASKTFLDSITKHEVKDIVFTWFTPLSSEVSRIEIIPKVNP
ncbi:MAG: hypothetical protein WCW87_03970 [Candidatus Paceibacterota bacterium]